MEPINKDWFFQQLAARSKSMRDLAKFLNVDPSATSRMFSGARKMRMDEAEKIARFLAVPVEEVLRNASIDISDLAIQRIMIGATVSDKGRLIEIEPQELPSSIAARAQAALGIEQRRGVVAAQVRAVKGPLSLWDDAVILFAETHVIEPAAVGVLSIAKLRDGMQVLGHLERVRKTGEATMRGADGESREVVLASAAPVLAVLP